AREHVDQPDLGVGRDHLGLVLEAVAWPDLAHLHMLARTHADNAIGCVSVSSPVPIVGGTGALGFGLALRLAREGVPVVIGSRAPERAADAAERLRARLPDADVEGLENAEAATSGPVGPTTVPCRAPSEVLTN